jgi:hypothetical protein
MSAQDIDALIAATPLAIGAVWLAFLYAKSEMKQQEAYAAWRLAKIKQHPNEPYIDLSPQRFLDEQSLHREKA